MLTRNLLLRIAGPSLLVSLLFVGACVVAAIFLHHRQSASLRALDESLESRLLAVELQRGFESLPRDHPGEEKALHHRLGELILQADRFTGDPEKTHLVDRLEAGFSRYLQTRATADAGRPDRVAADFLDEVLVPICRDLERFSAAEVERSKAGLQRTVAWTAWGLVAVGLVGATAGVLSGYAVARGLGRSVLRAESLAEVGQVAAGLAHELRNPLTAIKMLVQANLEDAETQGLPTEDLKVIEQEIRRMESRLNVFIDFARPPRPERRIVDVAAVVDQTLALVGGRARKQRVTLSYDPPPAAVEVEADGEQLRQLLVNLALNALDVMPRGGVLEIEVRPGTDGHVEIIVVDTGPGIPFRHLLRLYEPFFTSKETGLGLGLVVSQRIAQDHGGTLQATNRNQGGARFVLRLPRTTHQQNEESGVRRWRKFW